MSFYHALCNDADNAQKYNEEPPFRTYIGKRIRIRTHQYQQNALGSEITYMTRVTYGGIERQSSPFLTPSHYEPVIKFKAENESSVLQRISKGMERKLIAHD